ncbi:MAG: tyrosine-type recombinase/integrase [Candidatus Dormibacteria bacterium]
MARIGQRRTHRHLLKDIAEHAGITKRVYPHLLRYSFVTNYLRSGVNNILAGQIVGHPSLTMIQTPISTW